jgi:Helicase associated domain
VDQLNQLGFAWNAQDYAWERHKKDLDSYRQTHGHCHVPLSYEPSPKLGLWVKEQRRHYSLLQQGKPSHMTPARAAILDPVGFCWDTHEATWLERFRELKLYLADHGHCHVPTSYAANVKLGTWAHHQRRQGRKWQNGEPTHITRERVDLLESIGFVWSSPPRHDDDDDDDDDQDDSDGGDNNNNNATHGDDESTSATSQEMIGRTTPMYFRSHIYRMKRRLRDEAQAATKRRKTTTDVPV